MGLTVSLAFLLQSSNRVSPHSNSRAVCSRTAPPEAGLKDSKIRLQKFAQAEAPVFVTSKATWSTARLGGSMVLFYSKVLRVHKGCLWGDAGLGGLVKHHLGPLTSSA